MNNSNIAYNIKTKQFGAILWISQHYKILGCGAWPKEETVILTVSQARFLIKMDYAWLHCSNQEITDIFKQ